MNRQSLSDHLWREYSRPRFLQAKAVVMLRELHARVSRAYAEMRAGAHAVGRELEFIEVELVTTAIASLDQACEYCGELFGIETMGVVRRNPLRKVQGSNARDTDFSLRAVAVCCHDCASGHRMFTDEQWRGLLAELRKCDDVVAREAVRALGAGPSGRGGACG